MRLSKNLRAADAGSVLPAATMSEFDGVRYLHLGDTPWVQGAMRIRVPAKLHLEYVQRMMAWLLCVDLQHLGELHVVQLGLGASALTRFSHGVLKARTTAVEVNPQVVAACRQWFRLPDDDERLNVVMADAGVWVSDPRHAGVADVLQVDLYDHQAAAPVLDDEAFYAACHRVLADNGVMAVNLFGRHASFARSAARMAAAFGPSQVRMLSPTKEGNTIVLARKVAGAAVNDWPAQELMLARARQVEALFKLPAAKWVRMMSPLPPNRSGALREAPAVAQMVAQPAAKEPRVAAMVPSTARHAHAVSSHPDAPLER